ncbi:hypothetical protein QYE76_007810 [Lolium multiflorum]|uniref:Pentatricopeptide repeat-containing protein n=1 Tax=Lolium multiflorum TaxID=4521 RepID=A0AAD8QGZ1_LOLMU|nr:hypothetical protein QYE76_007810 [Lolium multiflorum]
MHVAPLLPISPDASLLIPNLATLNRSDVGLNDGDDVARTTVLLFDGAATADTRSGSDMRMLCQGCEERRYRYPESNALSGRGGGADSRVVHVQDVTGWCCSGRRWCCQRRASMLPTSAHDCLPRRRRPRALTAFLAAVARAPASEACSDGLSLVVALFNRMPRCDGTPVAPPTVHTYGILLDSCCPRALTAFLAAVARAPASEACSDGLSLVVAYSTACPDAMARRWRRPQSTRTASCSTLAAARGPSAFFGRFLRAGLKANNVIVNTLLKVLCHAKRTDEAVDVLLHRMPHLGCVPDAIS